MRIIREKGKIEEGTVIALGTFDGMHLAHQEIVRKAAEMAKDRGLKSLVFTFSNLPGSFFSTGEKYLFSPEEKELFINDMGVDILVMREFDEQLADMESREFLDLLRDELGARAIVCGFNYRYGRNRTGDADQLTRYGRENGIEVYVVPEMKHMSETVSSTNIRKALSTGDIETANALLGHSYYFLGPVTEGRRLGRTIGFPTINISYGEGKLLPPLGVYSSYVHFDGRCFAGVTNIGKRPTVRNGDDITVETYILDFEGDLYGKMVCVTLETFIRGEKDFGSIMELEEEIERNKEEARNILSAGNYGREEKKRIYRS